MEIDHIFVCVKQGAHEAEALKAFGLTEGTPSKHPGQGTANRRFFFHNAFIELLWLEDAGEAQSEVTQPTMLYERLSIQNKFISPFGIGFRPAEANKKTSPFPSWAYKPVYLPGHLQVEIASAVPLAEPMWFYLSFASRPDKASKERAQPLMHQAGIKEITSVRISMPGAKQLSAAGICASRVGNLNIVAAKDHLLEIGFDSDIQGFSHDFRPVLPLIFKW